MTEPSAAAEEFLRQLPLPLAQLYRRAHNAKTPRDAHDFAFYMWETSLKLLAAAAVVSYRPRDPPDPKIAAALQNLARPSLGHWCDIARRLIPVLAERGPAGYQAVNELLYGRARNDLPRSAALAGALDAVLGKASGSKSTIQAGELFDRLVEYRNKTAGHGAPASRTDDVLRPLADSLLSAAAELFARLDVLAGRRLVFIAGVRPVRASWLIERVELAGVAPWRMASLETARAGGEAPPLESGVYLADAVAADDPNALISMHPLAAYDCETESVLFLNARRGRGRIELLCYTTGRTIELSDAAAGADDGDTPVDDVCIASGRCVGEYELLTELGRGAMGVVYRAWQPSLGREVALKMQPRAGDAKADARFRREVRALGRAEHPNLIKVYTSGSDGEHFYYTMELVEGAPLSAVSDALTNGDQTTIVDLPAWQSALGRACAAAKAAEKSLSESVIREPAELDLQSETPVAHAPDSPSPDTVRRIVALIRQAADAAHALHEKGILHRDIKPGNILVNAEGTTAVLMDLGLAQLADDIEGRLTRTRQFVGTLRYASPQQVLAAGTLDRRTDIYSLGATLWELLALRPLFGVNDATPTPAVMEMIQRDEPERLRRLSPNVDRDLEAIVHKCLEKSPERRYATAADLANELDRWLAGEPVRARPVGRLRRTWRWARRRPVRAAAIAATVLLTISASATTAWVWNTYYRVHVRYFANLIRRHGVPEGIGPIDERAARTRRISYRFMSRAGRVEAVEVVNGHGAPQFVHEQFALIGQERFNGDEPMYPEWRFEYLRNARGELLEEIAYGVANQVLWRLHYTADQTAQFTDDQGMPYSRSGAGAAYVRFVWSDQGYPLEVHYLDAFGKPQPGRDGTYGRRLIYNERSLPVEETYFGSQNKPGLHKEGFAKRTMSYDDKGNLREQAWFDVNGRPALCAHGIAREVCGYDDRGNRIQFSYFGADGQPTQCCHGAGGHKLTLNEFGDMIENATVATDGLLRANSEGIAVFVFQCDDQGRTIEQSFRGADGQPRTNYYGVGRIVYERDDQGNATAESNFLLDGRPGYHADGNHKCRFVYDAKGQEIAREFYDAANRPTSIKYGNYGNRSRYDERGNEIELTYIGADGRPTHCKDGYAVQTNVRDHGGNILEKAYFGADGSHVLIRDGYHIAKMTFDERGNQTSTAYFGIDGQPVLHRYGFHKKLSEYDVRGNEITQSYIGLDGRPCTGPDDYARVVWGYDARNFWIDEAAYGPDERPRLHDGYHFRQLENDERGNPTKVCYFGLNREPVDSTEGIHGYRAIYDDRSHLLERKNIGSDGKPARHNDGYYAQRWSYDDRGNKSSCAHFGKDGELVLCTDGYASWTARYDEWGNQVEQAFFGADGKPILREGYANARFRYDRWGNAIEMTYFGLDGEPVVAKNGYHRVAIAYDQRGNPTKRSYFDKAGKPVCSTDNYAVSTAFIYPQLLCSVRSRGRCR